MEFQIFSSGEVARLREWAELVYGVCGQVEFTWVVPPISKRFATFLQAMYGHQWVERVLSPAGEAIFKELQAALVGYHSQTAFLTSSVLAPHDCVDCPGVPVAVEKISCGWGLLGGRITCQGHLQFVDRSRSAAFLYRFVPVLKVKILEFHKKNSKCLGKVS